MPPHSPAQADRAPLPRAVLLLALWAVVALVAALSIGRDADPIDAIILILPQMPLWIAPPLAYLASAVGYALLLLPLARGSADRPALVAALALAAIATVSQISGSISLLATTAGAVGVLVPGWLSLIAFLWNSRTARVRLAPPPLLAWLVVGPAAILLAAASAPPGWLWDSEYAGFDALSYHLQLPQEWLAQGRIAPQRHDVYSYLPGSYEAAVYHIAAMTGAPSRPLPTLAHARSLAAVGGSGGGAPHAGAAATGFGLLAADAWRLVSAQHLHALMTLIAAWLVARAARMALLSASPGKAAGAPPDPNADILRARAGSIAARIAGAITLATPWCVVVGSLAYNEMPVLALGASAVLVSLDTSLAPWRRGLLAGLLIGAACGFKPTAITFLAPGVAVLLLARTPIRGWPPLIIAGAAAGTIMLLPWAIRNWLDCGNPVFPFASSIFGTAHWSAEQIARYTRGHSFHGSILDRLALLIAPNPAADAAARDVERWRGLLNPQYAALFPAALSAAVALLTLPRFGRPTRRIAALLASMLLLQAAAWLFTTHLQSRFLLPMVLPAAILVAMALAPSAPPAPETNRAARFRALIAAMLVLAQAATLAWIFASQRSGAPNAFTAVGPAVFTGRYEEHPLDSPAAALNFALPPASRTFLLGDAAPLYLAARGPHSILWHTTWDASPLRSPAPDTHRQTAPESDPSPPDPTTPTPAQLAASWTRALRLRGVTHVLVNQAELARYARSGWYDPAVTPDRVATWLATLAPPIAVWDRTGQALFVLPVTSDEPAAPEGAPPP